MPFRLIVFLLLACLAASAAGLTVKVSDPQSAVVYGARVSLLAGERVVAVQTTSAEGRAVFTGVQPGSYTVQVLAAGFAPHRAAVELPRSEALTAQLALAAAPQTIVVTGEGTPLEAEASGSLTASVGPQQLELMQPLAPADVLRFLPGAVVNASGQRGGLAALFVRGGESRYNKVVIDGVPANEPGGYFDFGVVPMFEFDRLEFLRGPDSLVYGSDAMTSVVRLDSATGRTRLPELRFGAEGGNFSTARGYASLAGARGRFDHNLFAEQTSTGGDGVNNAYSNSAQGGNLGLAFSPRVSLRLRARHSNSRSGVSSAWNFNGDPTLAPDLDQYARQNNFLASADLLLSAPARWQHRLRGFEYSHRLLNRDSVADRGCDPLLGIFFDCPFASLSKFNRAGFEYQGEYAPRAWARTVFGYLFENEHGDIRDLLFGGATSGLRRNHAVYGEQIVAGRRGSLTGGLRFVRNQSFGNKLAPRLAGSLVVFPGGESFGPTRLRFAVAQGIKAPDFFESFGNASFFLLPNPDLKPEQNVSFEGGVQQQFGGRLSLSATYFRNHFRDRIAFKFLGPPTFESIFVNLNKALAHGAELEAHARLRPGLTLDASYTYTSTKVLEAPLDPASEGRPLLRRPRHLGSLRLNYAGKRWGGMAGGSLVGRRPDSDFFFFGYDHADGYARVDLGGWYAINRRITAYGKVENALDRQYNEVVGYPAAGANFRAGLRFRLGGD